MSHKNFWNILSFPEKVYFGIGAGFEILGRKWIKYPRLRRVRNIAAGMEQQGFEYTLNEGLLSLKKGELKFALRKNSSDYELFSQVFLKNEYKPAIDFLLDNKISVKNIIDAGSNIGLTAIQFLNAFPESKIICLEPDPDNFRRLTANLENNSGRVIALPNALWDKEEELFIDFGYRDGKEWSRRVAADQSVSNVAVQALTIPTLMSKYGMQTIDLLKIDIEGSEATVFKKGSDLAFLNDVKLLVIEIHDEFNCRQTIYEILREFNFLLFQSEDLTIATNMSYFKK